MLNAKKFGIAGAIVWSVCVFLCTLLSIYTGYAKELLELVASIYPGYTISLAGAFVGLVWAFVDAFIALYIFAWLYNKL